MTFLLCISFFIQPISNAYAQQPEGDVEFSQDSEVASEVSDPIEPEVVEEALLLPDEVVSVANVPVEVTQAIDSSIVPEENVLAGDAMFTDEQVVGTDDSATGTSSNESVEIEVIADFEPSTSTASSTEQNIDDLGSEGEAENSSDESLVNGSSDESSNDAGDGDENASEDSATSAQEQADENPDSEDSSLASSSQPVLEPTVQEVSVLNSDQAIAFNRNECTEVADGSFYCQKVSLEDVADDALFAAPDNTGDMEIYVVQDGVEIKLTDNVLEDSSPYFDSRSDTIVWHRLINDRYQIMSYDIDAQEEIQLTDTRVNNMEPTKSGNYTVWQRWVANNWEIILFDGKSEIQLTDSQKHDIAPHIYGDMIIWNVRSNDGRQSLMTYEISTQTFNQIADTEGVSVTNPRMLVTYEAQYQNGDSVLKGFDLATGEIIPIEHLPRDLPTDLPEPDATGETRALPTGTNDEEEQEQQEPEPNDGPVPPTASSTPIVTVSTTTVEVNPDLDLRPVDQSVATTTNLVVEQAAIPDVVIPAFEATTTENTASSTQGS